MRALTLRQTRDQRDGVTLVELAVVVGILGLLMALLLPAVQRARGAARRTQCQNNLRQILQATYSFDAARGSLPSLYNGTSLKYPLREWDLFHMHSWRVELLSFLEQQALRDSLTWSALATDAVNQKVAQAVVPAYICPEGSDPLANMGTGATHDAIVTQDFQSSVYQVTRSDYDAMAGIQVFPDPLPPGSSTQSTKFLRWGIWGWPDFGNGEYAGTKLLRYRAGRLSDVTDGLSKTIAVVERGGKPIDLLNGRPNVTKDNPNADYPGQVGWSASNTYAWAINQHQVVVNQSNAHGIYSLHVGGANVAMADGAVQFLSDATEFPELVRMFSRAGGPHE